MPRIRWRSVFLALSLMVLAAMVSPWAPPAAPGAAPEGRLAGELLIASPHIADPHFWHTVVLLVAADRDGAFGIVINRPIERIPIAKLLGAMGLDATGVTGTVEVFAGGPVAPTVGFVVHSAGYQAPGTVDIDGRVALSTGAAILEDIAHGRGPKKSLIAFGYAGWGAGQLAMEMARGDWFLTRETSHLVFDDKRARVWSDAMARRATPL